MTLEVTESQELADIALLAARAVGGRLREAFRERPAVRTKRDFHDPVTEHDTAAEETIREVIARHCPGSVVVGEGPCRSPRAGWRRARAARWWRAWCARRCARRSTWGVWPGRDAGRRCCAASARGAIGRRCC